MPIQGSLRDMSVLEAIQLIGTQRKTVTLRLQCEPEEFHLHFEDGLLVASHRRGSGRGEPYLEALVALTHLSPPESMRIAAQVRSSPRDLWSLVLDVAHLDRETCERVYLLTTEAIVDRVLLWDRGHFALLPPTKVEPVFSPGLSVDTLLLDAMRRLDEIASWKKGPLPPTSVPCLNGPEELYVSSDPLRRAVVRQVDGRRTMSQIVDATRLGEHAIYSTLAEGVERGWVQVLGSILVPEARPAPAPAREILQRVPAVLILCGFLALGVSSAWLGQRFAKSRHPWSEAAARWEEVDLRRSVEIYRYRHGSYPEDLSLLSLEGIPVPEGALEHWSYERVSGSYDLHASATPEP
jgi:hypothetical protein